MLDHRCIIFQHGRTKPIFDGQDMKQPGLKFGQGDNAQKRSYNKPAEERE